MAMDVITVAVALVPLFPMTAYSYIVPARSTNNSLEASLRELTSLSIAA